MLIPAVFAMVFPVCLVWAALSDAATLTISNRLNIIFALAFFPAAALLGLDAMGWAWHLGTGVLALMLGMALFASGVFGGGDAKLMAVALLWLGKDAATAFLVYTALSGGALAFIFLVARRSLPVMSAGPAWVSRLLEPKGGIPYGVALCAGGLLAAPHSGLFSPLMSMLPG